MNHLVAALLLPLGALLFAQDSYATENTPVQPAPEDEEFIIEKEQPSTFYGYVDHYFTKNNPSTNRSLVTIASFLIPGSGQIYHEQYLKGATHFGFFAANALTAQGITIDKDRQRYTRKVNKNYIYMSDNILRQSLHSSMAFSTRLYSAFDAYRTASLIKGKAGGNTPISQESFSDLALAPFTPRYFSRPLVFAPIFVLGAYSLGRGSAHNQDKDFKKFILDGPTASEVTFIGALEFEGVAIGEEAFFRGVVNTEMIRAFGPLRGIAASSVIFGLTHNGSGISASALTASLYGLYLGYIHHTYDYQLGPGIALHFWWNTIVQASIASRSDKFTIPLAHFSF